MEPSYASGTSTTPLLGDTIGDNLDRTIARVRRPRGARLRPPGPPLHVRAVRRGRRSHRARVHRRRDRAGRARRDLEPELRRVGARPVRHRQGRDHPGQHQPGLPDVGARVRAAPVRLPDARRRDGVQDLRLRADGRRRARRPAPALEQVVFIGRDWEEFIAGGERVDAERAARRARPRRSSTTRSTSSTRAAPRASRRARRSATTTSSTTATSSARGCRYTEQDRVCIPVPYYHCFGMVMGNLACTSHGACMVIPAPARSTRWRRCRPSRTSAARASTACRRCSSPSSSTREFGEFDLTSLRTGIMAGSPCPIETMRRVVSRDAHGGGHDLLRHDRDLAGVDADGRRRPAGEARRDRRPGAPARRGQGRRPRDGRDRRARRAGRAVHARLQRDARLLGGAGEDRRRDRPRAAGCTPATSRRWTTRAT